MTKERWATLFLAAFLPLSGYGWSENIGWLKFTGPGYGVEYDKTAEEFNGYGWSENIGWIKFGSTLGPGPTSGDWARACAGAANLDCTGPANHASGGWDGWIKLAGGNFGPELTSDDCSFEGYSWGSDVIGWIKWRGDNYGVTFADCAPPPVAGNIDCGFSASPSRLVSPRRNSTLSWSCSNATSCTLSGVGAVAVLGSMGVSLSQTANYTLTCSNDSETKNFTTTVTVIRPQYCEIIPFLGACR